MGRVRVSRAAWARAGVLTGGGAVTAGVGLAVDLASALMVGGGLLIAYCLLLADVAAPVPPADEDVPDGPPAAGWPPPGAAVDLLQQPPAHNGRRTW